MLVMLELQYFFPPLMMVFTCFIGRFRHAFICTRVNKKTIILKSPVIGIFLSLKKEPRGVAKVISSYAIKIGPEIF